MDTRFMLTWILFFRRFRCLSFKYCIMQNYWMYRPDLGVDLYSPNDYREIPNCEELSPSVEPFNRFVVFQSVNGMTTVEWHDGLGWHDPTN